MSKKVTPIPRGYRTATPCLVVSSVEQAIEFYAQAFDASVISRTGDPSEQVVAQATIKIGNSLVILQQESLELGLLSPLTQANSGSQLHLYIEDIDSLWTRALDAGAVSISAPVDTYWGDRSGILHDIFGHRWSLASRIEMVSKDEIKQRYAELFNVGQSSELPELPLEEALSADLAITTVDAAPAEALIH